MAVDVFLKIQDVAGESVDSKHKDEIDVLSWSWGATQSGTTHLGPGGGSGKVNVHDLTVTKYVDKSTPTLLHNCFKGKHIPKAWLTVRKAGDKPLEYLKVEFEDLLITSVQQGGSDGMDRFTETLTINFAKIKYDYTSQTKDGSGGPVVGFKWDIAANE